ncbi:TVP38/TMEM64 family protein [Gracilibacillus dipsosauri]|uniref:TVP38/TMEM64 family membrane protein n=1 Tax=Gracilibacillus dipsosauri TaxID=178340 RepID=A0A317L052_9BACI|nr:VTT domain-containing protein [Gracilibacillus dipsosauri]PWU68198.1 alkaline phosphatase [Gracilibacillus dipsosauri]
MQLEWLLQMKLWDSYVLVAPMAFIFVHILRPILFLPVLLLCITGGLVFGIIAGTIYSVIGLLFSSIIFYCLLSWLPVLSKKCEQIEKRWLKQRELTIVQICLLRLLPFMHFHLLSFCIYQNTKSFIEYLRTTLLSVLPLAIVYTALGDTLQQMPIWYAVPVTLFILILVYFFRRKQTIIKWQTFFSPTSHL